MKLRLALAVLASAALTAGTMLLVTAHADAAPAQVPAPGHVATTVYGCVNQEAGTFDYFEFNTPLPHKCWFAGETLVPVPAIVLGAGSSFPLAITVTDSAGKATVNKLACTVGTDLAVTCS